jgi:hypothetical protein
MTPELNVVISKTEIITLGIASACTPRAFGLFRCGYMQHWM